MGKKRYFIYAYDEFYGGLHGMYDGCFIEGDYEEAEMYGYEMSRSVIESYSEIYEQLLADYETEEEQEEALADDIAYEIYELREDAPSFEELYDMNLDPQSYIEEFCITR